MKKNGKTKTKTTTKKTQKKKAGKKKTSKKKVKSKGGAPTKYRPSRCKELEDYFNVPAYSQEIQTVMTKQGIKEISVLVPNDLPTKVGFACLIGVHRDTINEWTHKYPKFSDAIKKAEAHQEHILVTNGLRGHYAQPFAIFTAKNILGWRDKKDVDFKGNLSLGQILEEIDGETRDLPEEE